MTVNSENRTAPAVLRMVPGLLFALVLLVGCAAPVTAYNQPPGPMTKGAIKRMVAHEA
jgi:hypothetical protein